jgi:hypothetical protein
MRSNPNSWRRGLAGVLVALHLALVLGASLHAGPHLDPEIVWLPYDLHHHEYGFAATRPDQPHGLDLCVACQFSRLVPRLAPAATSLPSVLAPVHVSFPSLGPQPQSIDLDHLGPRAPPIA